MAKEKLSNSGRLNTLLYKMSIYSFYDVVNHLPRRYDDYSLTRERNLDDKERVTIYAKVISSPLLTKGFHRVSVTSFEVMTE